MKIYDISQEVFTCQVYPGDPAPEKMTLSSMEKGGLYNLTAFYMCAHNGTHIDAPYHFLKDGRTVDAVSLEAFVGMAFVAEHHGIVSGDDAAAIIKRAKEFLASYDAEAAMAGKLNPVLYIFFVLRRYLLYAGNRPHGTCHTYAFCSIYTRKRPPACYVGGGLPT